VSEAAIEAVLVDLDYTLYPQADFLEGAWRAVAEVASAMTGHDADTIARALAAVAAEGSDRGRIIDRALERVGLVDVAVAPLVAAFRGYVPERLRPFDGAIEALAFVLERVPVGLVSDGDPNIQWVKLRALGLEGRFDVVVLADELGREHRKPDPLPFETALFALGVPAAAAVFVGDRPDKDICGAHAVGMRSVRVRTGEYAAIGSDLAWREAANVTEALLLCQPLLSGPRIR
jgi:putative hydrolase of the HAD superfamily